MARRRTMRASRGVKDNVWTVVLLDDVSLAASGQSDSAITTESDWSSGGERATMLTVRGWLSINGDNEAGAKLEGSVFAYIGLVDQNIAAAAGPTSASTYVDEVILTTMGGQFVNTGAGDLQTREPLSWDINVKTKRTFQSGTDIRLVISNQTGKAVKISGVLRALLRKGGN